MTVAAQKKVVEQALALPKKMRARLACTLWDSLELSAERLSKQEWNKAWKAEIKKRIADVESGKVKAISHAAARRRCSKIIEAAAAHGRKNGANMAKTSSPKREVLSKKEWNEAWMKELKVRAEEMESGADPGVPLGDVLKFLDKKPGRRS
jgi:putative addiction module component (TIGR02574 family)